MLIRCHSDLHLEAFVGRDAESLAMDFIPPDHRDAASLLVLAGDISSHGPQLLDFIEVCRQRFRYVLFVPGNHEFYRHNYDDYSKTLDKELAARYDNDERRTVFWSISGVKCTDIDGVRFIYGPLWGDGGPTLADQAKTGWFLNDFRLIRKNFSDADGMTRDRLFTVADMVKIHEGQREAISAFLQLDGPKKKVVVTHHLPSRRLVSPRFRENDGSDGANGGFVGNCESILAYDHAPDFWLHGHTHDFIDTQLWKTRVICNPTGYRGEWDNGLSGHDTFFVEV